MCGRQEGVQVMSASRSKCPPAVPKRGPDTRLSSTSSSSESSVISLQVITDNKVTQVVQMTELIQVLQVIEDVVMTQVVLRNFHCCNDYPRPDF